MKNKNPRNNKGQPHGLWIYHFSNGIVWYKGQFINNIRHGYWIDNFGRKHRNVNNIRYGYWMDNWDNLNDKYKIYFYLN